MNIYIGIIRPDRNYLQPTLSLFRLHESRRKANYFVINLTLAAAGAAQSTKHRPGRIPPAGDRAALHEGEFHPAGKRWKKKWNKKL